MAKKKSRYALREVIIAASIIVAAVVLLFTYNQRSSLTTYAEIEGVKIALEVAEDPDEKRQGLSGRQDLVDGNGMLFVYDNPGLYGYWMKDMNFSIDMIWLDTEQMIVHIEDSVSPDTYPEVFYPAVPAQYVLEVPAGTAQTQGFNIGDEVTLEI